MLGHNNLGVFTKTLQIFWLPKFDVEFSPQDVDLMVCTDLIDQVGEKVDEKPIPS